MLLLILACSTPGQVATGAPFALDGHTSVVTQFVGRDGTEAAAEEWWVAHEGGWEQGWDVAERPAGNGPLVATVATSVPAVPHDDHLRVGRWMVREARAWDALGADLPTALRVVPGGFAVEVLDEGAAYPVTIDPVYSTAVFSEAGAATGDALGTSVALGDFDGDGYPEGAVGAPGVDDGVADEGAVYVYDTTLDLAVTGTGGLGAHLAAGDADADGYDDLAAADDTTVYLFPGSSAGLGSSTWSYTDAAASVATALAMGDLDDDGMAELYLGASGASGGDGQVAVFDTWGTSADSTISGGSGEALGRALAVGTDNDGDGFSELLVGSQDYTGTASGEGAVLVYGEGSGTLSQTLTGGSAGYALGLHVADGGDTNGDGYGDVWVAAYFVSGSGDHKGRVLVYEGSASGYESAAQMNRTGGPGDELGYNGIAGGADIDADGYDDVLATVSDLPGFIVYYGQSSGLASTNSTTVSLSSVTGLSTELGAVAGVRDFDADGFDEFLLGDAQYYGSGTAGDDYGWVGVFEGYADRDGDGFSGGASGGDCDDGDPSIYPGATDTVADGIDSDCDGFDSCYADNDGDGYGSTATVGSTDGDCDDSGEANNSDDCNDSNASAYPGGTDTPGDSLDGDCDGTELCYVDGDADGYGSTTTVDSGDGACSDTGEAINDDDCDDADAAVSPTVAEVVGDGVDNNCDGYESCQEDLDGDGFGGGNLVSSTDLDCADAGETTSGGDCNDGDAGVYPAAFETPGDGVDQNCDDAEDCYDDADGDTHGSSTTVTSADTDCDDAGEARVGDDCDDADPAVYPGAPDALADGVDTDCDGVDDCYADADGDGFGGMATVEGNDLDCSDAGEMVDASDCDDADATVSPAATEAPGDGIDQDCDGYDECFEDRDGDGYGADWMPNDDADCDDPEEARDGGDCDDENPDASPGEAEIVGNGIDDNCDGIDGCFVDADGDGIGGTESTVTGCGEAGTSTVTGDCGDDDPSVFPGATESCNGVDDDCDGETDEDGTDPLTWYADGDGDGYGDPNAAVGACAQPEGHVTDGTDCDDTNAAANPGATEDCEGSLDLDCDGQVGNNDVDCTGDSGSPDGDTGPGDVDADTGDKPPGDEGCGCAQANGPGALAAAAGVLALLVTRRGRAGRAAVDSGRRG